jgi:hypothetical protein
MLSSLWRGLIVRFGLIDGANRFLHTRWNYESLVHKFDPSNFLTEAADRAPIYLPDDVGVDRSVDATNVL